MPPHRHPLKERAPLSLQWKLPEVLSAVSPNHLEFQIWNGHSSLPVSNVSVLLQGEGLELQWDYAESLRVDQSAASGSLALQVTADADKTVLLNVTVSYCLGEKNVLVSSNDSRANHKPSVRVKPGKLQAHEHHSSSFKPVPLGAKAGKAEGYTAVAPSSLAGVPANLPRATHQQTTARSVPNTGKLEFTKLPVKPPAPPKDQAARSFPDSKRARQYSPYSAPGADQAPPPPVRRSRPTEALPEPQGPGFGGWLVLLLTAGCIAVVAYVGWILNRPTTPAESSPNPAPLETPSLKSPPLPGSSPSDVDKSQPEAAMIQPKPAITPELVIPKALPADDTPQSKPTPSSTPPGSATSSTSMPGTTPSISLVPSLSETLIHEAVKTPKNMGDDKSSAMAPAIAVPPSQPAPASKPATVTKPAPVPAEAPAPVTKPAPAPAATPAPRSDSRTVEERIEDFVHGYLQAGYVETEGVATGDQSLYFNFPIDRYFDDFNLDKSAFEEKERSDLDKTKSRQLTVSGFTPPDERNDKLWRVTFKLKNTGTHWSKDKRDWDSTPIYYTVYAEVILVGNQFKFTTYTNKKPSYW